MNARSDGNRSSGKTFDDALLSPEYLADPYRFYLRLRSEDPVHWCEPIDAWVLTRYDDVLAAFKNPAFSKADWIPAYIRQLPDDVQEKIGPLQTHLMNWMVALDPPDHTRLRKLVHKAFTPKTVEALTGRIQEITNCLLDNVQDGGQMDVIASLAFPLPVMVICDLLGVPASDRDRFHGWSEDIVAFTGMGRADVDTALNAQTAVEELTAYFRGVAEDRREHPRDDLISRLVHVEEQGDRLSEDELFAMFVFLLVAGHETTVSLIANGLLALMRNPDEKDKLQRDPSLAKPAIEELLRFDSPLQFQTRVANVDQEVRGKRIRKGQRVLPMIGAANRDPAQFPDPSRLDVGRDPNRHIAFGYGIHYCLGAPLARLEGQIVIGTVLDRMPKIALLEDSVDWQKNLAHRVPVTLPVTF